MAKDERIKWIAGIIISALLTIAVSANSLYQNQLDHRMTRMENSYESLTTPGGPISQMLQDLSAIKEKLGVEK